MNLKLCVLASGSKGNCTYISDGETSILVDVGLPYTILNRTAEVAGVDINSVSAIVNTHEHTDHCKGIACFLKKHDIPVYSHKDGIKYLSKAANIKEDKICGFNKDFHIGSLSITPFTVCHDAAVCCGFSFENNSGRICMATDLGHTDDNVLSYFYGSDLCVIESNHDTEMLIRGRYPYSLKKRIMSDYGHLSNNAAATAIEKLIERGSKNFILAHLSEENNLPELAFSCISGYLGKNNICEGRDFSVTVATQHRPTKLFCL